MQPAAVALAIALFLFLLVQGLVPPLLYAALLVPVAILIYGLVSRDLPERPYDEEEAGDPSGSPESSCNDSSVR
jgi:hypothetical protein